MSSCSIKGQDIKLSYIKFKNEKRYKNILSPKFDNSI